MHKQKEEEKREREREYLYYKVPLTLIKSFVQLYYRILID